jgi:tRNA modification GTPase
VILVRTKMDQIRRVWAEEGTGEGRPDEAALRETHGDGEVGVESSLEISVETGEGMAQLRGALRNLVFGGLVRAGAQVPVLTRRRHTEGVRLALEELRAFRVGLEEGLPAEVAATHLRPAETALEELLGVIPREEILDRVFRDFCIGK